MTPTPDELRALPVLHDNLVGVDSDGCVFDTMEVKQKLCFHGEFITRWGLEAIEPLVRETLEFTNLYSSTRGFNRFVTFLRSVDLLQQHPEVLARGVVIPDFPALRRWVEGPAPHSNTELAALVEKCADPELTQVYAWSLQVNENVANLQTPMPPFENVRECLELMQAGSDMMVVSATPEEALVREWNAHNLTQYVQVIAGQELGSKQEHLKLAAEGKYPAGRVLMIGDSPGDLAAAKARGVRFFPILHGNESASWATLRETVYPAFLDNNYSPEMEASYLAAFHARLPTAPPWVNKDEE